MSGPGRKPRTVSLAACYYRSMRRLLTLIVVGLLCAGAVMAGAQDVLHTDAASMQKKLAAIMTRAEKPPARAAASVRTSFTDREVNAYFKVHGPEVVPDGLVDPQIVIDDGGKVRGRAIVDLDAALKPKERSWLDPLAWLGGKMEVLVSGNLKTTNGKGVFALETATLGGIAIPQSVLQTLVSYYSKSPDRPNGFELDKPFDLPASIRSIETRKGAATIVQ